jgi:hypothetical protein
MLFTEVSSMFKRLAIFGFVLNVIVAPVSAASSSGEVTQIAGRVLDPEPQGGAWIKRLAGGQEPARFPALLYGQDHILLSPGQALTIRLAGQRRTLKADATPLDYVVPLPGRETSPGATTILQSVADFFYRAPLPLSTPTYARGPGAHVEAPTADPLVPIGQQWITSDTNAVALIWRGQASALVISGGGGSVPTYGNYWARIDRPGGSKAGFAIKLANTRLEWRIGVSAAVPVAPGINPASTTRGDRLGRALWLLQDGPSDWRLYALSEISSLAKNGDFLAGEMWNSAQSGHLDEGLTLK